ncbi:MAG: peptide deformylase [Thiotrichales bacterium]|jgi:peptide deformylase|nr:peptide deformylase [Thiotrichales bacterium]MBT3612863.1 peptide deformylase [Thiotrichales bacterium]MBT3752753.1 peptide deformylase [Thiotrichales bacterium]MBT3836764.1 peptide deformylase [Thiotrichales bacterium]MBT4152406.1 peptide deformylase [Thiotrichales bacterium]
MKIITYPEDILKQSCDPVTKFDQEFQDFVAELESFMRSQPGGIGIAAPQVGRMQRLCIVDLTGMTRGKKKKPVPNQGRLILVNPEITKWEGFELGREGCMSVPDYTGNVIRATRIELTAFDEFGNSHNYESEGYEARAIQHEADHLDGLLFLDRLVSRKTDLFKRKQK